MIILPQILECNVNICGSKPEYQKAIEVGDLFFMSAYVIHDICMDNYFSHSNLKVPDGITTGSFPSLPKLSTVVKYINI